MVISAWLIPKVSLSTLTSGATQLVVQEALDTTVCCAGSYLSSLTPMTTVKSSPLAGGGNNHLLGPALKVAGGLLGVCEEARGLDDQLDPEVAPRNLGGVPLGKDLDGPTVDNDVAVGSFDGTRIPAVVCVVLEEVGVGLGVREIVDGYDFELVRMSLEYGSG